MPYHVEHGGGSCSSSEWAVIKDSDGETMGCHPSKAKANDQLAALYANDPGAKSKIADRSAGRVTAARSTPMVHAALGPNSWRVTGARRAPADGRKVGRA